MRNNLPILNGFPTDKQPSTRFNNDIIVSKFMTRIQNHQRCTAPTTLRVSDVGLIGTVLLGVLALVVLGGAMIYSVFGKDYKR